MTLPDLKKAGAQLLKEMDTKEKRLAYLKRIGIVIKNGKVVKVIPK